VKQRLSPAGWRADEQGGETIDVLELIDRLEQLVSSGTRLPLSSRTLVDEQEFLDIIDQLRVTVPEEIKQARRVSQEKDRVILQAEAEADKIINAAREQATAMLQENELVHQAQEETQRLIEAARQEAEEIRRGADVYAMEVLSGLENELTKLLATVRKGRATLDRSTHRSLVDGGHSAE
jgi:vacuolar-type H+-ATPase subunit H